MMASTHSTHNRQICGDEEHIAAAWGWEVGTECVPGDANVREPASGDGCTAMSVRMPLATAVQRD